MRYWVLLFATSGLLSAQVSVPSRLILDGPVVLQDGQTVLFSGNFTPQGALQNTTDLYALGPGGVRRLTTFPRNAAYIDLYYNPNVTGFDAAPDGSRMAVAYNGEVLTVGMATGAQQVLFSAYSVNSPRLTPDGRTVLISVPPFTGHLWFPYLYSVPLDGGAPVKLARGTTDGRHPFSNDGTIVFTSPGPSNDITTTTATRDVYTMSPDGTAITQLTHFSGPVYYQTPWASQASITPDGKRIMFITQVPTGPGANDTTSGPSMPTARDSGRCRSTPTFRWSRSPAMAHWWRGTLSGKST